MKILFISHDAKLYGAPRSLLNLIQGLQLYHPEVELHLILPYQGLLQEALTQLKVPYTIYQFAWNVHKPPVRKDVLRTIKRKFLQVKKLQNLPGLIKIAKAIDPDIIYTNTSVIIAGALLSKFLRKKHVWHIREFAWEDHGFMFDFGNYLQRRLYNQSALLIVISKAIQNAKLKGLTVPVKQIYNGVYFKNELIWQPKTIINKGDIVFGMVSGIRESKGQKEAVIAFSEVIKVLPLSKLLLAGEGSESYISEIKALCTSLNIAESVVWQGFVQNTETCYNQIDILLSCSNNEGMGRSILEAMAHGIPVISKNAGGAIEMVQDNKNGYLYNTTQQLVGYMLNLSADAGTYAQFSATAIQWVKDGFTIEAYTEQVYKAIVQIA